MSHHVHPEHIVATHTVLIEGGAEHCDDLIEDFVVRLEQTQLADCGWHTEEVAMSSRWWARAEPWLVLEHRRLVDIRHYVRCRPFGAHLEVLHVSAIEPPAWKRAGASLLGGGAWWSWSLPHGTTAVTELQSWLAVVTQALSAATKQLSQRLARGQALGQVDPDTLAWW